MQKNVIIYTRVSTDEQADKGFSLAHQKAVLEVYCSQKGYTILKHFQEDFSAKNFERPEWKKLLAYLKTNKRNVDELLFTRWDRFSRNTEEAYRVIREFKLWGIETNAIEQPLDTSMPDSKVMLGIYLILPEVENDKISIRVREGLRRAMTEGCFTGIAPIGYVNHRNEDGKSTLAPHPEKAALIVKVFEEYASGLYSAENIRKRYYNQGLKVSRNTMLNILKNPVYLGLIPIKEYKKEEAVIRKGLHPAIVDQKTFDKVQLILRGKHVQAVHTIKVIDQILPLRGFLKCTACNKTMTGSGSKGRNGTHHFYYHCNPPCRTRFKAHEVHQVFTSLLSEFVLHDDFTTTYKKVINQIFKQKEANREVESDSLNRELNKLTTRLDSVNEKYFDELIDLKTYNTMKRKTESQIGDLKARLEEIDQMEKDFDVNIRKQIGFLQKIDVMFNEANTTTKKKIVSSLFPERLIFEQTHFTTPKIDPYAGYILLGERPLRYLKVG